MEKEFIPYELAVKLKELGFDEECFGYYYKHGNMKNEALFHLYPNLDEYDISEFTHNNFSKTITDAPLWQQAFDWFRNEYGLYNSILNDNEYWVGKNIGGFPTGKSDTYEEARLECLKKLIELCEKN